MHEVRNVFDVVVRPVAALRLLLRVSRVDAWVATKASQTRGAAACVTTLLVLACNGVAIKSTDGV